MTRFRIDIPQSLLDDLRERLARVRWPSTGHAPGWQEGTDSDFLRDLIGYWRVGYD
jgi:epoxide hydrolase